MRWSITGTTASVVHSNWAVALRQSSGLNLRRRTTVEPRPRPMLQCRKPHEWNIGAATWVISLALSGIFDSSVDTGSSDAGWERDAPLGEPVVPEVRITTRPFSSGGTT